MTYHSPDRRPIEEWMANRTKPARTPRECVEACLGNLEMARRAAHQRSLEYGHDRERHAVEAHAYAQAIALLRVECAGFLEAK